MFDFSSASNRSRTRRFLAATGLAAAFLTIAYVDVYLHGGPRGLDAPVYWLQGRALSRGGLSWAVPGPTASYRARGLIAAFPERISGVFPPGYPLLLAAGFLVGAPMLIGPLLSGAIVIGTWLLARELALSQSDARSDRAEQAAALAAGLSIVCAALRQQTADTLPHGAAALAIVVALTSALRGLRAREPRMFAICGLALGWLLSARPLAALPIGAIAVFLGMRSARPWHAAAWSLGAMVPGVALLLAANHAATGHAFVSAATEYARTIMEVAATPDPGRSRIGEVLGGLSRHVMDVANFEPLALATLLALTRSRRTIASSCTALVVAAHLATHVWGSQDVLAASSANFAEVLPLEHALLGYGLAGAFASSFHRIATITLGLALGGFSVHAVHAHAAAGASDIGRPRFEPDVLQQANATAGLLFFDDDQGFELANVPGADPAHGGQAARLRGDDHDRVLYEMAGRPSARRYVVMASGASTTFWSPTSPSPLFWRFEAESDWPPMIASGGAASRLQVTTSCVSGGGALALSPSGTSEARLTLELPVPAAPMAGPTRIWTVTPRIYELGQAAEGTLDVVVGSPESPSLAHWSWRDQPGSPSCRDLAPASVELGRPPARAWLVFTARGGQVALDRTLLR